MSLVFGPKKAKASFLFWRKRSTKIEPTPPPLRIKVINRGESERFFVEYAEGSGEASQGGSNCLPENMQSSELRVGSLPQSNGQVEMRGGSNEEDEATSSSNSSDTLPHFVAGDNIEVEAQLKPKPPSNQTKQHLKVENDSNSLVAIATTSARDPSNMTQAVTDTEPLPITCDPVINELTRVPSNLEILDDLRSKLLAEKLKRRMEGLSAEPSGSPSVTKTGPDAEELERRLQVLSVDPTGSPSHAKTEPDDSLSKPPKKPPTKSFIEYRRELFACSDKYAEVDPPARLVPGGLTKDDDNSNILTHTALAIIPVDAKRPNHEVTSTSFEQFPKPKVPPIPAEAQFGEDVAMHEILTAIHMFVSPEYEIQKTVDQGTGKIESGFAPFDAALFSACLREAGGTELMVDKSQPVIEPSYHKMDGSGDLNQEKRSIMAHFKNDVDGKTVNHSPIAVHELNIACSPPPPTRSRSMDWTLRPGGEDYPQDEKSDDIAKFHRILSNSGYTSLTQHESPDMCCPIKRCESEGLILSRSTAKEVFPTNGRGRSVTFQVNDDPVARKIDFGGADCESKSEGADDEDDSAVDSGDHEGYQQHDRYVGFKRGKAEELYRSDAPSVATNLQEAWNDWVYLFEVISEEFWSGLLGDDDLDLASTNASTTDGTSLDESTVDTLYTDDREEYEQYLRNRKRQQMWRSYRRKLESARKVAYV